MTSDWRAGISYLGGTQNTEIKEIEKLAKLVTTQVADIHSSTGTQGRRPQHAKGLAVTSAAQFIVAQDLAHDLRVGFLVPGAAYSCSVRFSNAGALVVADKEKDLRGCAIKLKIDNSKNHDFLMTNAEIHHAKNAIEAMWASYTLYQPGVLNKVRGILRLIFKFGLPTARRIVGTLSRQVKRPVESLATEFFWSRAPYRFGSVVVKFRLSPDASIESVSGHCSDLTAELSQRVLKAPVTFGFEIQRYVNEASTPLEDSTQSWPTPFERIGTLVIAQGTNMCEFDPIEKLAFNPWTVSSHDFEPLGNMNRARRHVYAASVIARNKS